MSKEIVVNVGERETRIAVLEDDKLVELHIERAERVVGSLYKCRVSNVLQGMDAAFVDIGLDRNAFLYVGDVLPTGDPGAPAPSMEAPPAPAVGDRDRRQALWQGRAPCHVAKTRQAHSPACVPMRPHGEMPAEVVVGGRAHTELRSRVGRGRRS